MHASIGHCQGFGVGVLAGSDSVCVRYRSVSEAVRSTARV
ncbi:hypothetical protein HSB1_09540 [Halogranum salarium B-1]|uniref:Uncharacterized protein n=1 Tax=Halogranum salarium B-1 TaxID=1210908 RepID=J3JGS6_9EURY|nr:hypothetical protein HSB1_09540 [Halogranum salarium B-1]